MEQNRETEQDSANQGTATSERRPGWPGRLLRWTAIAVGGTLSAIVLGVVIFLAIGVSVDLSWLRGQIEGVASDALGRSVAIEGPIVLVPATSPTVQVEGIRVGNPEGWPDADFVRLNLARAQLGVLPLLRGGLQIDEITVDGLAVSLETNAAGEPNWILAAPGEATLSSEDQPSPEDKTQTALRFVELRELSLTDIAVNVRDAATDRTHALRIDEITGSAEDEQPMDLAAKGSIEEIPFAVTLTAGSLATLLTGEAAWPLDLSASAFDTELSLSGEIAEPLLGKGLALDFSVQGPDKQELEKILGTELPPIGSFDLRGRIGEAEGAYRVTDLQGELGAMTLSGELEVDLSGTRPRLQGAIDIPRIDAGALLAAIDAQGQSGSGAEPSPETGDQPNQTDTAEPADQPSTFDVDQPLMVLTSLEAFDVDATLAIHEVVNGPVAISEAEFKLSVADGKLVGPVNVTVAQVPLTGEVRLEPQDGKPAASVSLSAEESDIGELLELVLGAEGVRGSFDSVELGFSALGETVRAIVGTAELRFALAGAALSYGHDTGGQPVEFTLDNFDMRVPAADESRITAEGTLLSEAFALELSGGTFIENYIQGEWPFALTATGGGAQIQLSGTAASDPDQESPSELEFSVSGERVGDLSRWIGIPPDAELPYALNGQVTLTNYSVLARIDEARMGNTAFDGKVGLTKEDGPPVTLLELGFDVIDVTELADNLTVEVTEEAAEPADKAFTVDVPILPNDIELMDSDIRLAIEQIKTTRSDITEASFSAQVRNGYLETAPVRATIAGATFEGTVSADLRGDIPMFDLDLNSTDVDVGDLLARLGVGQGLDVTAGNFDLSLGLRGASVRTILERSEFSASISEGHLRLRDPNTEGSLDIGIPQGTIAAGVGTPIALDLDGRIDAIPVRIGIQTDSLASFAAPKDSLRATLDVALLNAELNLTGTTPLPIAPDNLRFELGISGDRISDFDELLDVSLPPWGPYQLGGKFGSRSSGYFIDDFQLGVGGSTLTGTLELDTTQTPPRLDVDLVAPTVQLDDFETGDWQAAEGGETTEAAQAEAPSDDSNIRGLLSPQVMRSLDGTVTITVEEVVSGQDRLGSGTLVANLSGGRLVAEPIAVDVPGGSVEVGLALEPTETDIGLEARAKIEQLDYGLLARRIDPESTTGGLINVDVDIATRGSELSNVMAESNGHIDFAVWPADLDAGLFDLWAVNLFTSILPSLDSEASKVNCVVARFSLTDGIMRPTALLLDTSRIQASGDGTIDFTTNTIDFVAAPNSKSPQMFSAQTPIQVRGSFSDFDFGVKPGGLAGTAIRMITSPLVVPFQWTFSENVAADGEVACREAWTRPPEG